VVDFAKMLTCNFYAQRSQKRKITVKFYQCLFALLGSVRAKAARKTLVKSNQNIGIQGTTKFYNCQSCKKAFIFILALLRWTDPSLGLRHQPSWPWSSSHLRDPRSLLNWIPENRKENISFVIDLWTLQEGHVICKLFICEFAYMRFGKLDKFHYSMHIRF